MRYIITILCLFTFICCNENDNEKTSNNLEYGFYDHYMIDEDVYRLPIVEPFQLITAYCCQGWNSSSNSELGKVFGTNFSLDSLNVIDDKIVVYPAVSYDDWGVLSFNDSSIVSFSVHQDYLNYMEAQKLDSKLYSCEVLYLNWRDGQGLPWLNDSTAGSGGNAIK